jgi:hypothetical protein
MVESGYGDLLRWACRELCPAIAPAQRAALIGLADQLHQDPHLRLMECCLEHHHDQTGRVDLLFHCQSRRLLPNGIALPDWWPALVKASDRPDGSELFGVAAEEHRDATGSAESTDIQLSGWHWLEFDQSLHGAFGLAGLFQHCTADHPRDPRSWARLLDHFHGIGCFPDVDLRQSEALRLVFETFGVPVEWGIMVGRSAKLKLVAQLAGTKTAELRTFCQRAGLHPALHDLERWCHPIANPPEHLQFAISLDLNLADDTFAPSVGLEVSGPHGDRMPRSADIWAALEPLLNQYDLAAPAKVSLRDALQRLPRGEREELAYGGLDAFLAEEHKVRLFVAFHNHVKFVFHPDQPATVKSYLMLRLHKGAAPGRG